MKKRTLILIGLAAMTLAAVGCGKKNTTSAVVPQTTSTPIPSPVATEGALIDMQKDTGEDADIKNVIGEKKAVSNKVVLINQLGSEIVELYVRPHTDQYVSADNWGNELIAESFVLKNGDKALYYYEPKKKDDNDETIRSYDLRVSFEDEDADEYFFREIPLDVIKNLKFCVDGTGDSTIPYVRYTLKSGSTKEISTLEDVKKRLGMQQSEDEEPTPTPTQVPVSTATPTPDAGYDDDTGSDDPASQNAAQYIGQSLDTLTSALGSPSSSEYVDEPETGRTGYHYYDTFTVSTSVDENGNEVVAGVW